MKETEPIHNSQTTTAAEAAASEEALFLFWGFYVLETRKKNSPYIIAAQHMVVGWNDTPYLLHTAKRTTRGGLLIVVPGKLFLEGK